MVSSPPPDAEAAHHLDREIRHLPSFHLAALERGRCAFSLGNVDVVNVAEAVLGLAWGIPNCPANAEPLSPSA